MNWTYGSVNNKYMLTIYMIQNDSKEIKVGENKMIEFLANWLYDFDMISYGIYTLLLAQANYYQIWLGLEVIGA